MSKVLATCILEAAKMHEDSWQPAATHMANGKYALSIYDASCKVCGTLYNNVPELAQPVYLLLNGHWNDAIDWALGNKGV